MINFRAFPLTINLAVFAAAAVAVWYIGARVSFLADAISRRTGLGKAFMGLLLLALVASLPELTTTVTAASIGNTQLALNNVFGGIVVQTAILAIVDLTVGKGALTFFTPKPVLMLEGVLLILLLAISLAGAAIGEAVSLAGVGLWALLIAYLYVTSLFLSQKYQFQESWEPKESEEEYKERQEAEEERTSQSDKRYEGWSLRRLILFFAGSAGIILVAGVLLAWVGDALAVQTGLGSGFVGATLIAAATSLPELSTTLSSVRMGNFSTAVSNIFGSNSLMLFVLFVADIFYRGGPILNEIGPAAVFSAAMGIVVTTIYLAGLIEHRNRTILRMGIDSVVVLVVYAVTLAALYQLR